MIADFREMMKIITIFVVLLVGLFSAYAENDVRQEFNYDDYAATLKAYVNNQGMVNYKELKSNREKLDSFLFSVGRLNTESYEKWSEKKKITFYICGPPVMMNIMIRILRELGVSDDHIHYERFAL